jgi:hypothetical protein
MQNQTLVTLTDAQIRLVQQSADSDQRLSLEQWGDEAQVYRMSLGPATSYSGRLPVFLKEAKSMLRDLSAKTHEVLTGLAVINASSGKTIVDFVRTKVKFRKLTDEEIANYVDADKPFDKAGAYAIQEKAGVYSGCLK